MKSLGEYIGYFSLCSRAGGGLSRGEGMVRSSTVMGRLLESFLFLLGTQPRAVHIFFLALEHYLSETWKFKSD